MNIEIRNIKIASNLSEETIAFTADVFVNGKKTAYARNDGRGGCTHYSSYHKPNNDYDLRQAEAYAKSLPSKTEMFNDKPFTIESNLEQIIDNAIYAKDNEREQKKFQKKIQKACETHIVWGIPNSSSFKSIGFNGKPKLIDIGSTIQGQVAIKNLIEKIKKEMKEGEVILNKNIKI
jgi:hypothetical protein